MNRYLRLSLVLLGIGVAFYGVWKWRQPTVWTAEYALVKVPAPPLSDSGDPAALIAAIDRNISALERIPASSLFRFGSRTVSHSTMIRSIKLFKDAVLRLGLTPALFDQLVRVYDFYTPRPGEALITGYYLARLKGSRTPSVQHSIPLYRAPTDLITFSPKEFFGARCDSCPSIARGRLLESRKLVPYHSREEIEFKGALSGKGLELVWVSDRVEAFFLHIQGSGEIALDTGEIMRVSPAGANGHPYRAIGGVLAAEGAIPKDQVSMQSIRAYLAAHPERVPEILSSNPSFVFYSEAPEGPRGSLGVPVTAYRSVATDHTLFPKGALMYLDTKLPGVEGAADRFRGLVLNQDTGGAIRGPKRLDLFVGPGEAAELVSGNLKHPGTMYFLVLKDEYAEKEPW